MLMAEHWWDQAACLGHETDDFYLNDASFNPVCLLCDHCPVVKQCLADALEAEQGLQQHYRYGLRAFSTPADRWRIDTKGGPHTLLPPCGTVSGWRGHRLRDEQPCGACRSALEGWKAKHYVRSLAEVWAS